MLVIEEVLLMSILPRELSEPELVRLFVKVNVKSPVEKISLLLVARAAVKSNFPFDKMLPEFVKDELEVTVESEFENISASV